MILADTGVGQITAGLGVLAAAVVAGQFLFYKFVHTPAIDRADKALAAEITRGGNLLEQERARSARLETKIDEQNEVLQTKALPALITASATVTESQALLRELRRDKEISDRERERETARAEALAIEQERVRSRSRARPAGRRPDAGEVT